VSSRFHDAGLGAAVCALDNRHGRLAGLDELNPPRDPPPRRFRIGQSIAFNHFVSEPRALWLVDSRESLKKSGTELKPGKHLCS